ncbi:hypothetical protein RQP46_000209 [Phenoliferia psychrophenolica]
MTSPSPKPWSSLFYFPSAAFRPFPSPLQAIAQSRPSAVVLFSLSPVDEGLVVNVLSAKESDKELLRSQLWGGAIIRFLHSNENDTATPPFKQSPSIIDSDEIPLATAGLAVANSDCDSSALPWTLVLLLDFCGVLGWGVVLLIRVEVFEVWFLGARDKVPVVRVFLFTLVLVPRVL